MVGSTEASSARETRSVRVGRELEELRRRNAAQLAQQREREQRVEDALRDYSAAGARVATAESRHEAKRARLQARLNALHAEHAAAVDEDLLGQARAVRVIYECGRTVRDLAQLLDMSQRAVSRLLDRARTTDAAEGGEGGEGGEGTGGSAEGKSGRTAAGDGKGLEASPPRASRSGGAGESSGVHSPPGTSGALAKPRPDTPDGQAGVVAVPRARGAAGEAVAAGGAARGVPRSD